MDKVLLQSILEEIQKFNEEKDRLIASSENIRKESQKIADAAIQVNFYNKAAKEFIRKKGLWNEWDKFYTRERELHNEREKMKLN